MTITPQELQQVKDRLNPIKENQVLIEFVFRGNNSKKYAQGQGIEGKIYRGQEYQPLLFTLEWEMGILRTSVKMKFPNCHRHQPPLQHLFRCTTHSIITDIKYVWFTILFKDGISTSVERKFSLDCITQDEFGITLELYTLNPSLSKRAEFSSLGTKIK